jgi:hypothetical protein
MATTIKAADRVTFTLPAGHPRGPGERVGVVVVVWDGETAVVEWWSGGVAGRGVDGAGFRPRR